MGEVNHNENFLNEFNKIYNVFDDFYNKGLFKNLDYKIHADDVVIRLENIIEYLEYTIINDDDIFIFETYNKEIKKCVYEINEDNLKVHSGYLPILNKNLYILQHFLLMKRNVSVAQNVCNSVDDFRLKINDVKDKIEKEAEDFRRKRNIADNAKTEDIYDKAVKRYYVLQAKYRKSFYWAITVTIGLSLLGLFLKNWLVTNEYLGNIEFWVLKVSILAVGITLITFFLKQSTHYQRLADQNYQTQVELQAYPTFIESIPLEEAASVRKELALKYFGREIDGAAHKDMSNLISDQMKSTTEMVKAATDVLKAKG